MRKPLFIVLLFYTMNLAATTYYVAKTGSDSNIGSNSSSPFLTIGHAAEVAVAGDTVIVEDGTYVEAVTVNHSGTSTSPIIFRAQNHWGAIMAPTSTQVANNAGMIFQSNGSYVWVEDFEMIGPSDGSAAYGIKMQANATPGGSNSAYGGHVLRNKIHFIGTATNTCISGSAINSGQVNAVIDSNEIYDIGPTGGTCGGGIPQEDGIYLTGGNGTVVTNNLSINVNGGAGMQARAEDLNFPSNVVFANNTVVHPAPGQGIWIDCEYPTSTCANNSVTNNLEYNLTNGTSPAIHIVSISGSGGSGGTWGSGNLFSNNVEYNTAGNVMCCGQTAVNTLTSNPLVVHYTGDQTGDYHLCGGNGIPAGSTCTAKSPAIGAGIPTGAPNHDFDGNPQPGADGLYEIGAHAYAASTPNSPNPPSGLTATVH